MVTFAEIFALGAIGAIVTMAIWETITPSNHNYHQIIEGMLYGMVILVLFIFGLVIVSEIAWRY